MDGLVVSKEAVQHPSLADLFTLGECRTDAYPSDWGGPDTIRSRVVLYWGSFAELARIDPSFDWREEIWETLTHELRHHLESLAREDDLEGVDYAAEEDYKREDGLPWDPWYFQHGDHLGGGVRVVEGHAFVEQEWAAAELEAAETVRFRWYGLDYEIDAPHADAEVHFVRISGGVKRPPPMLELVLVRKRSWLEDAKRLFGASRTTVAESEARARIVRAPGEDAGIGP